jgi:hypothetical protein
MNKTRFLKALYIGLLVILSACQVSGNSAGATMIKPGDTIDGMVLTTSAADAPPVWAFCSQPQYAGNTVTSDCNVPMVSELAIGHTLMPEDHALARRDWSEISWEMTIDGNSIDLQSFGTYNFLLPAMSHSASPVREVFVSFTAWDVVLTNLSPGEHTINGLAQMGDDSHIWVIHLTIEGNDFGTGTSWAGSETQNIFLLQADLMAIHCHTVEIPDGYVSSYFCWNKNEYSLEL